MMETNKLIRRNKIYLTISLTTGLLLLAAGVLFEVLDIQVIQNNKAVTAVSFLPLGMAIFFGINLAQMKRNPKGMRPVVVAELDERLVAMKQRANSITYNVLRWTLTLLFFGYTFAFPAEVFESAGWWIVFGFFFTAHVLQGVLLAVLMKRDDAEQG